MKVFNLTGSGSINFRVPTDIVHATDQSRARQLSLAIHQNHSVIDGLLYPSRFTGGRCVALYDRAIPNCQIEDEVKLTKLVRKVGDIYRAMNIKVVP